MSDRVDLEEDEFAGWCVAPTETDHFSPRAFFVSRADADAFCATVRAMTGDDCWVVLPAVAPRVIVANDFREPESIAALKAATGTGRGWVK